MNNPSIYAQYKKARLAYEDGEKKYATALEVFRNAEGLYTASPELKEIYEPEMKQFDKIADQYSKAVIVYVKERLKTATISPINRLSLTDDKPGNGGTLIEGFRLKSKGSSAKREIWVASYHTFHDGRYDDKGPRYSSLVYSGMVDGKHIYGLAPLCEKLFAIIYKSSGFDKNSPAGAEETRAAFIKNNLLTMANASNKSRKKLRTR